MIAGRKKLTNAFTQRDLLYHRMDESIFACNNQLKGVGWVITAICMPPYTYPLHAFYGIFFLAIKVELSIKCNRNILLCGDINEIRLSMIGRETDSIRYRRGKHNILQFLKLYWLSSEPKGPNLIKIVNITVNQFPTFFFVKKQYTIIFYVPAKLQFKVD